MKLTNKEKKEKNIFQKMDELYPWDNSRNSLKTIAEYSNYFKEELDKGNKIDEIYLNEKLKLMQNHITNLLFILDNTTKKQGRKYEINKRRI